MSSAQVTTAQTIVQQGKQQQIGRRGIRIALAVAMQESSLNPAAVNGPYVGLFQQMVDQSSGLYTQGDRLKAQDATRMFFEQLTRRVPDYETDPRADWEVGEVIQETNVGRNVLQWFNLSQQLLDKLDPEQSAAATAATTTATAAAVPKTAAVSAQPTRQVMGGLIPVALRAPGIAFIEAAGDPEAGTETGSSAADSTTDPATDPAAGQAVSTSSAPTTDDPGTATTPPTTTTVTTTATTTTVAATSSTRGTTPTDSATSSATSSPTTTRPTSTTTSTTASVSTKTTGTTATPSTAVSSPAGSTANQSTGTPPTKGQQGGGQSTPGTQGGSQPTSNDTGSSTSSVPTTSAPATSSSAPATSNTTSAPVPTVPTHNPPAPVDVPNKPVPTGQDDDPSAGTDPPAAGPTSSDTPAPLDCSPDADGRSTVFDPGMIISDAVFYNSKAMDAAAMRTFLNRLGAACQGSWCLRNLKMTTPDVPADRYCKAYQGGENEDVAAILTKLSAACGINPQVMLVTLQKESALLTRTDVSESSYAAAYGWHCPDTGPGGSANCDPQYAGFFNQAAGMAKQWARYRLDPDKYNYRAGQTTTILWNVAESGCGGSSVYIRNTATASLYNYTPYQPNAASLAAYPGEGDKCSSYGNRNFFMLFQKYFGVTGGGAAADIVVNGVAVTIPSGPNVAAGAAGKAIKAPNAKVAKALAAGFAAVGLPYVYGGGTVAGADQGCARAGGALNSCQGIVGFDCSGLTAYVLGQAGVTIPDYSGSQRAGGTDVPWSQGLPGDIIGYDGHVAIYLGEIDGTPYLLEAPTVGMQVQIRPVYRTNNGLPVDSVLHRYWN